MAFIVIRVNDAKQTTMHELRFQRATYKEEQVYCKNE